MMAPDKAAAVGTKFLGGIVYVFSAYSKFIAYNLNLNN
jgi:hypothetical protein